MTTKLSMGVHLLLFSADPDADRAFLAKVLELPSVDAGGGWPIFALPPAEMAVHPAERSVTQDEGGERMMSAVVYLMCEDVQAAIAALSAQGIRCPAVQTERWGLRTSIPLPSGASIGLYQPLHPTALGMV
jgi:hypothetical protein